MANNSELHEWKGEGSKTHPGKSLGQQVLLQLRQHSVEADFPAQIDAATGNELSFGALLALSVKAAEGWRSLGLGPGRTVVVVARNTEMLFPAVLGAIFQGVTVSGIAPYSTESELRHCLSLLQPDAVLSDPLSLPLALQVAEPRCIHLVTTASTATAATAAAAGVEAISVDEVLEKGSGVDVASYQPADVGDFHEHVAFVYFSSGSTGLPKAIMLSNYGFSMSSEDSVAGFRCVRGERLLITSPMSWVTGIGLLVACTLAATTRVCDTFTTPAALVASLRRYQVNCWFTVPPLLMLVAGVLRSEGGDGDHGGDAVPPCPSLRAVVVGGAILPADVEVSISKLLHCDIHQAYASTEALIVCKGAVPLRPGSVGKLIPGIRMRLVDPSTGRDLRQAGQIGEIRVITPSIMKGYKDNPKATAESFDEHGFFCTGDLAYLDEDGYCFVVGRLKELLKYKGDQVAPAQVEAVLLSHSDVNEACVVGRPHPLAGDVPAACVVRRAGSAVTERELKDLVADRLSDTKRLRGGVVFVDQLPKTSNGKVSRKDCLAHFDGLPMEEIN